MDGDPPNRVAFEFFDGTAMLADSKNARRAWLDRFFPGSRYKSGAVYVHGFLNVNRLIFPGEDEYLANITQKP
jgi:hypothetical protein